MSETTTPVISIDVAALKATVAQLADGTGSKKPAKKTTTKKVTAKAAAEEPKPKIQAKKNTKKSTKAKAAKAETPMPTLTAADIENAAQQVSNIVLPPLVTNVAPPVPVAPVPVASVAVAPVAPTVQPDPPELLEGTPAIVVKLMQTGMTEKQTVKALVSQVKEHPEIHEWASEEIKPGRPKASLVSYYAVKRGVRTALKIDKPAPKKANLANAADLASKLSVSVPATDQSQATLNDSPASILEALKPSAQPLRKFTNENSGRVFLLWSDYLAAKSGQYTLRFRKFTVGENSKPGKGTPSVYLLKGETDKDPGRVVAKLSAREFVVMLDFLNKLGSSGALGQIFQALVEMEKE